MHQVYPAGHRPRSSSPNRAVSGGSPPSRAPVGPIDDLVLALDESAGELSGGDMSDRNVPAGGTEERDPAADEDRDPGDDEALNEAGPKEVLDGDTAVDIEVAQPAIGQRRHALLGRSRHPLDDSTRRRRGERPAAQDEDGLVAIGPSLESQHRIIGVPADHQGVDAG